MSLGIKPEDWKFDFGNAEFNQVWGFQDDFRKWSSGERSELEIRYCELSAKMSELKQEGRKGNLGLYLKEFQHLKRNNSNKEDWKKVAREIVENQNCAGFRKPRRKTVSRMELSLSQPQVREQIKREYED